MGKAYANFGCRKPAAAIDSEFTYMTREADYFGISPELDLTLLTIDDDHTSYKRVGGKPFSSEVHGVMNDLRNRREQTRLPEGQRWYGVEAFDDSRADPEVAKDLNTVLNFVYSSETVFQAGEPFCGVVAYKMGEKLVEYEASE